MRLRASAGSRSAGALACAVLLGGLGCSGGQHPQGSGTRILGRVAVRPANVQPEVQFGAVTHGPGASGGAALGAAGCIDLLRGSSTGGSSLVAAAVVLFELVCLPVAATAGAVAGGLSAEPAGPAEKAATETQRALATLRLEDQVRDAALAYARASGVELGILDPDPQAGGGAGPAGASAPFDSVLEIQVLSAQALAEEGLVSIRLDARVVVADARSGKPVDVFTSRYLGKGRPLSAWLASDGAPVQGEIDAGMRSIAEQAVDEVLLTPLP